MTPDASECDVRRGAAALLAPMALGGVNSARATASIGILSASMLFGNSTSYAFNDLAGQISGSSAFDLGLPFFFGRYVYYGLDQTASGGQQPFVAF